MRVYYSVYFRFPHIPMDGFCYLPAVGRNNHICGWWLLLFSSLPIVSLLVFDLLSSFIYDPFGLMCASCLCFPHFSSSVMMASVLKPVLPLCDHL